MRRPRLTRTALLALIEQAYAAAEDAEAWAPLLIAIADALAGTGASLLSHDLAAGGAATRIARVDPEAQRLYNAYYHQVDAWALGAGARNLTAAGRIWPDHAIVPRADLEKTEYFPYVRRFGISRMIHAMLQVDARGGIVGLTVSRDEPAGAFGHDEVRFLETLAPHLERALRLRGLCARATADRDAALDGLDGLDYGVALVTNDARVLHANRLASAIIERRDGLLLERSSLRGASPAVTAALRRLCADAAETTAGGGLAAGGALSLPRPSGHRALQLVVCPVRRSNPLGLRDDRAAAILFIADPEHGPSPDHTRLQIFYGLTATEARVAAALAQGKPLEEIAAACRYTRETTRWYSKQILAKTGCRNRAALVRELSRVLAPTPAGTRPRT
jgi:DNA-binding CsgD family transcriptional regulator